MRSPRSAAWASITALLILLEPTCFVRADDVPSTRPPSAQRAPTDAELAQADHELALIDDEVSCMQSCSSRSCSAAHLAPFSFARGEMRITPTVYGRLRALRPAILVRIGERLLPAIRASVEIDQKIAAGNHYNTGHHEHLLMILIDLNAVEALPLLLEALAEAERLEMSIARTQVLSTITGILRQEGYRPLLESELERRYGEALAAAWAKRSESDGTAIAWARMHGNDDPVHGLPQMYGRPLVLIDLTPELRAQIETWARDFLATTPDADRKGAAAMVPRPVMR
jgi:hypothetical protein